MTIRLLSRKEIMRDGDEYREDKKWRPVSVEDIGVTVSDSGYNAVRRREKGGKLIASRPTPA